MSLKFAGDPSYQDLTGFSPGDCATFIGKLWFEWSGQRVTKLENDRKKDKAKRARSATKQ